MSDPLRRIPAVDKVLQALGPADLPRPTVVALVRRELSRLRRLGQALDSQAVLAGIRHELEMLRRARLQPVINATGIIIHTNLGRAPLAAEAVQAVAALASNYTNLELDLTSGDRGGRAAYLENNLALLCGAEAATVVNNCAAALVLVVRHFTRQKRDVIISRGELVQIGGGFRISEILEASGARLCEIGATNKTSLQDYAGAITSETGLILKVHQSNFFMGGFVESPATSEIAALARAKRLPLVEDLGSGAIIPTEQIPGCAHEPAPAEVLKSGVDLVTFSGDKLLGGPQAGIIAGRSKQISALKRDPLFRALRCDKLIFAALQTTVDLYLTGAAERSIPILALLRVPPEQLRERAQRIIAGLHDLAFKASIGTGKAQAGGGTLPRSAIPSVTLDLMPVAVPVAELTARLRKGSPPVLGYVAAGQLKLDLRTVFPWQDDQLRSALEAASG